MLPTKPAKRRLCGSVPALGAEGLVEEVSRERGLAA